MRKVEDVELTTMETTLSPDDLMRAAPPPTALQLVVPREDAHSITNVGTSVASLSPSSPSPTVAHGDVLHHRDDRDVHSPPQQLTENEEQLARLHAYDEMGDTTGMDLLKKSRDVFVPSIVSKSVGTMVGTVGNVFNKMENAVDKVMDHIPRPVTDLAHFAGDNVKLLAATTAYAIDKAPDVLVNAIPDFIMNKETKKLLFVDFNNTLRSFFHTNILAMPYVFNETGLVTGLLLVTFVASCSLYATETFMRSKNQLLEYKKVMVYGDVPRLTFGDWYPSINIFYGVIHLISFQTFSAKNMQVLFKAMGIPGDSFLLGLIIPCGLAVPLVFMKEAKHQRPLSVISNFVIFLCVVMMFSTFPYTAASDTVLSTSGRKLIVALGVVVYAFTGIGSAVPVERTMDPILYIKLLRVSVGVSFVALVAFGLAGYLSFGQNTCSVIILALEPGGTKTAISALMFVASIAIIPQQVFPFAEVIDRRLLGLRTVPDYYAREPNLARLATIAGCALVSYLIPFYGLILSIGGSVACSILGLLVPALLDYSRRRRNAITEKRGMRPHEYIMILSMVCFGLFTLFGGVLFALYDMWFTLQQGTTTSSTCVA